MYYYKQMVPFLLLSLAIGAAAGVLMTFSVMQPKLEAEHKRYTMTIGSLSDEYFTLIDRCSPQVTIDGKDLQGNK